MRKISIALILFFLMSVPVVVHAQSGPFVVLLDPAHGGSDTGVVYNSLYEKDLTLKLARLIREEAKKVGDIRIHLTRDSDADMSFGERVQSVHAINARCLLSLHINAGFSNKANGYEAYFPGFGKTENGAGNSKAIVTDMLQNKSLNESVLLFQSLQTSLETVFPRRGRGLRNAQCPLLEDVNIPALILEIGFATNPLDRKRLSNEKNQREIAKAIVKGLRDYSRKPR